MAASTTYGEANMLQIDVGGLLKKFTQQGFPTLFRVSATSQTFAEAIGRYTLQHNPASKIAIVTDRPAVTQELAHELVAFFASTQNKVVTVEQITGGEKDFSSVVDKLRVLEPDVVICSCYTLEAGLLARQMHDKKMNPYFYGWDTLNSPDFLNIVGAENTSKIISIDYARPDSSPNYNRLLAEIQKRQWPVETTTIMTYAAMQVFAQAVQAAHSLKVSDVVKVLRQQPFDTVLGKVRFDQYGDRIDPEFSAYQWQAGKLILVENISKQ